MRAEDRKKALALAAVAGLLAAYWGWKWMSTEKKAAPSATRSAPAVAELAPPRTPVKVDLELLKRPRERYVATRNIFSPVYRKPELIAPPIHVEETAPPPAPAPPPPPPKSPAEIAVDNAKEGMNKLAVLGFLKRKERVDIFFSMGNDYFVAAKGGEIARGYYLTDIGRDYVVVSDKATGTAVRLAAKFEEEGKGTIKTAPSPGIAGASRPTNRISADIPPGAEMRGGPGRQPGSPAIPSRGSRPGVAP